jgi:lysophospholipase L1-like esterase
MNTHTNATRILCYGDSNTWGRSGQSTERYPTSVRWTTLLQQKLGQEFEVIEEGLRSRTTNLDDSDPEFPGRNGMTYLRPCLESHSPLNIVILWLGTNDLKTKFDRRPEEVVAALEQMVFEVQNAAYARNHNKPKILLISSPLVKEEVLQPKSQFEGAGEKSKQLAPLIEELARKTQAGFLNLALHVEAGDFDGVHLDPDSHSKVAELMYGEVTRL